MKHNEQLISNYMKYCLFLAISLAIVALDQATKLMIHTQFSLGEKKIIIPGFFNFSYVRNPGGVFGLFSESNEVLRMLLFLILPVLAFVFIAFLVHALDIIKEWQKLQLIALSFIFGGAMGNYIDRIHFGFVVDFLDFHIKNAAWPTFNIGDSFIVIGGGLFAFTFYKIEQLHKN